MQGRVPTSDTREASAAPRTLLIASEIRFLRESLGDILGRDGTLRILGYSHDSSQTVRQCQALRPDMVLLDAAVQDGVAAVRELRACMSSLRVVVFAVAETVDTVLQWAEAGVAGYIPSAAALADLQALLADIAAGRQACSAPVSAALLRRIGASPARPVSAAAPPAPALTPREMEIVGLIGTGLSNKDIARRLNIGVATTKSHVHSVLTKLGLQRRGQAARWMHVRAPHS